MVWNESAVVAVAQPSTRVRGDCRIKGDCRVRCDCKIKGDCRLRGDCRSKGDCRTNTNLLPPYFVIILLSWHHSTTQSLDSLVQAEITAEQNPRSRNGDRPNEFSPRRTSLRFLKDVLSFSSNILTENVIRI